MVVVDIENDDRFGRIFDKGPIALFVFAKSALGFLATGNVTETDDEYRSFCGRQLAGVDFGDEDFTVCALCVYLAVLEFDFGIFEARKVRREKFIDGPVTCAGQDIGDRGTDKLVAAALPAYASSTAPSGCRARTAAGQ